MYNKITKVIGILLVVALFGTLATSAFASSHGSVVDIAVNDDHSNLVDPARLTFS